MTTEGSPKGHEFAQSRSQTARVADELLRRVRSAGYTVGERLPSERQLALDFGVSRPVIREALRMLVMLEVVEVQVGRGTFVTAAAEVVPTLDLTVDQDLMDIVDVREVIEVGALRLAQRRSGDAAREAVEQLLAELQGAVARREETTDLDTRLHRAIIEASGSAILKRIWSDLEGQIRRSVRMSPTGRTMSPEVLRDHEALAGGVTSGRLDESLAAAARLHSDNRRFLAELAKRQRG